MNRRTTKAIQSLKDSGNSASLSLADHLETVAANGGEQATTAAMIDEAHAMIDAARYFLAESGPKTLQPFTLIDALDAIPCTVGLRAGIVSKPDRSPSIGKIDEFRAAARERGHAARQVAEMLANATGFPTVDKLNFTLSGMLARLDTENREAVRAVLSAIVERGGLS